MKSMHIGGFVLAQNITGTKIIERAEVQRENFCNQQYRHKASGTLLEHTLYPKD
jgi:hypothetical protein